ncbi:MAG: hypothetical protein SVY41_01790 [Candidatus Nanohaloarchaea archaeon]|nr:hypothetical protein [Candidatus Nanohaloarchaea archaeon]
MGFALIWTDDDIEHVAQDFGQQVSDSLDSVLEGKKQQIQWVENIADLSKRVHNMFGIDGLQIAEIQFTVQSAEYRAICVVVPESDAVVYYTTVPKKGSYQERRLDLMRRNSRQVRDAVRRQADEFSP